MNSRQTANNAGFSLMELLVAMTITLVLMGIASTVLKSALGTKVRESDRTDALTSAQAALNVMSREIANSGYGIFDSTETFHRNGIVLADSNQTKIRVRSNIDNSNVDTYDPGEDVTYYFDAAAESIIRYDATPKDWRTGSAETNAPSYVVNRVSSVSFLYHNYTDTGYSNSTTTPTEDTARVQITVVVNVSDVQGVSSPPVTLTSDVTLRNSKYMMLYY